MPIDPRIILQGRSPRIAIRDPYQAVGDEVSIVNALQQGDINRLKLQDARQGMADEQAMRAAFIQSEGNNERFGALLGQGGLYKQRQAFDKANLENDKTRAVIGKDTATAGKSRNEVKLANLERGGAVLSSMAKDQQSYEGALRFNVMNGFMTPEDASQFPREFNPEFVKNVGMTITQMLADQRAREQQAIQTRGQDMTSGTAAAGRVTTERGQNMTDARAQERLNFERQQPRGTYDAERGVMVDPRTGVATPVTVGGQPLPPRDKPLTEAQGRGQMFGTRAAESDKILQGLEDKISTTGLAMKRGAESLPGGGAFGAAGNLMLSPEQQKVEQAQRDFVNAVLRQESGAVISPSEFENAQKQYFPQPGDGKSVRDQKRKNRQSAIEGFRIMAGSAGGRIDAARSAPSAGASAGWKIEEVK
jgi:hypothetical protein